MQIFEKDLNINLAQSSMSPGVIGSSEKCIDQVKQPCHTVESVKLVEYEMKTLLERLVNSLFGKKLKYRWVSLKKIIINTVQITITIL